MYKRQGYISTTNREYSVEMVTPKLTYDEIPELQEVIQMCIRDSLSINELCKIAMKLRPEIEARAKEKQGERTDILTPVSKCSPVNTRKELADAVGVGQVTMGRAMKIEDDAPQAVKDAVCLLYTSRCV